MATKTIKTETRTTNINNGTIGTAGVTYKVYYDYDRNEYYLYYKYYCVINRAISCNFECETAYYIKTASGTTVANMPFDTNIYYSNGVGNFTLAENTILLSDKYAPSNNYVIDVRFIVGGGWVDSSLILTASGISIGQDVTTPIISMSFDAITPTSCKVNWSSNIALKSLTGKIGSYSFYSGTFTSAAKGGSFNVTKLKAQTTYSVTCLGVRWNHIVSGSKSVNMTTTALPTISTTPSMNIGSNITMSISKTFPLATTLRMIFTNTTNSKTYTKDTTLNANTSSVTVDLASVAPNLYSLSSNVKTLSVSAHIRLSGTDYNNTAYTVTSTSKTGTATVVNSNPTFSNFTYGQSDTTISGVLGSTTHAPNGCGNLNMQISTSNKGVAKNSATMARYDYEIRDFGYNGADAGDGLLIRNGTLPYYADATVSADIGTLKVSMTVPHTLRVSIRAVDSRGFTSGWVSKNYVLIPYEKPTGTFNVHRVNNFEQEIVWDFESYCYLLPIGGTNKNTSYTAKVRVYDIAANTWTEYTNISNLVTASTTTYYKKVTNLITDINRIYDLPREKYYKIEFTLSDSLYSTVYTFDISAGISILGIHDDGHVTVGVQPDFNNDCLLQIGSDASLNVDIDSLKAKIDALF